jgi:hypothetical protein
MTVKELIDRATVESDMARAAIKAVKGEIVRGMRNAEAEIYIYIK